MYTLLRIFALLTLTVCSLRAQTLTSADWNTYDGGTPTEAVWGSGFLSLKKTDVTVSAPKFQINYNSKEPLSYATSWNFTTTIAVKAFEDSKFAPGQMLQPTVSFWTNTPMPNTWKSMGTQIYTTNGRYETNGLMDFTLSKIVAWSPTFYAGSNVLYVSDPNKTNLVPSWSIAPGATVISDIAYSYDSSTKLLSSYLRQNGSATGWSLIGSSNLVSDWGLDLNNPASFTSGITIELSSSSSGTAIIPSDGDMAITAFAFDNASAGSFSAVPEPSTYAAIMGVAALGVGALRKRMKKMQALEANV